MAQQQTASDLQEMVAILSSREDSSAPTILITDQVTQVIT